jgi:CRP-like cAMP-binding protein
VAANPKVADAVIRSLVSLVRRTTVQRCDLVFRDVTARVVAVLLERSVSDGTVRPTLTQTELAQLAGGTRQTVNQVIHSLEAGEAIRLSGRTITVLDRAALERRLGD